jgi:hypothetical protein
VYKLNNGSHQDHMASLDGQDAMSVDKVGVVQVVKTFVAKDLSNNLEPHNLTELGVVLGQQLRVTHVEM